MMDRIRSLVGDPGLEARHSQVDIMKYLFIITMRS